MNLASYQLLQPAMYAAYLHRRAAFKLLNKLKTPLEAMAQRRTSCDDKIGIILLSPCISYTTSLWLYCEWTIPFHLDFQSFPCSPDCNVFNSACTDNSSFRCSPSAYLMQISWISVCRASFRRVTAPNGALRLLLFHAYFSVHQYVKDLFFHPIC